MIVVFKKNNINNMESQNISEKPIKSTIWIVGTIWANIIIVTLIVIVTLSILNVFISRLFGESEWIFFWRLIIFLLFIFNFIYSIKLGVSSVVKKSVILKENIIKISAWTTIVAVIGQISLIIITLLAGRSVDPLIILPFTIINAGYFIVTYFWFRKIV